MAFTITIAGSDRTKYFARNMDDFRYTRQFNSAGTLTFTIKDKNATGTYRPSVGDALTVTDGGTTYFTGRITDVSDRAFRSVTWGTVTTVTATDQMSYPDQRVVRSQTFASGTSLKSCLTSLNTTYLAAFSVTVDAGMATGPTLDAQTYDNVTLSDVFRHLMDVTGWLIYITPGLVLKAVSPGSVACPYNLSDADANGRGELLWSKSRQQFVNTVYLMYGPNQTIEKTDIFTGTGSVSSWTSTYAPVGSNGFILSRGYVVENGAFLTLSAPGGGGSYTFDISTNILHRVAGNLTAGQTVTFIYTVQFPQTTSATDSTSVSANGAWDQVFTDETITEKAAADSKAAGILSLYKQTPKTVTIETILITADLAQSITLAFPSRGISSTSFLITQIEFFILPGTQVLKHRLTCQEGSFGAQSTWIDYFRSLATGGSTSSGTATGGVIPVSSGVFATDVSANNGSPLQVTLRSNVAGSAGYIVNSQFLGPIVGIGAEWSTWAWALGANYIHLASGVSGGAGRRTFNLLDTSMTNPGGGYAAPFIISQDDAQTTREYYLGSDPNSNLTLGVPGAGVSTLLSPKKLYLQGYAGAQGEWTTFTPTWSNLTVGNGTSVGKYTVVGKTAFVHVYVTFGTTTSVGGAISLTLPVNNTNVLTAQVLGNFEAYSGTQFFRGRALVFNASIVQFINDTGGAATTTDATHPFTWGTGSQFDIQLAYETP